MPTLFEAPGAGPRTHALIIGVGAYRHLEGGSGPEMNDTMGLGQLTSPPQSAIAITDWVLHELKNPAAPLGSVELLLSDATTSEYQFADGSKHQLDRATLQNTQMAFQRWFQRCNSSTNNVALFFYSGHGVMKTDLCILPEDFGDSNLAPFSKAINFDRSFRGMTGCAAKVQCFFVDSCSQVPALATQQLDDLEAVPLITARISGLQPREALRLHASTPGNSAYGLTGKPTRFTEVLLECLKGGGSERVGGKWRVTLSKLSQSVTRLVAFDNTLLPIQNPGANVEGSGQPSIHELDTVPTVSIAVGCEPDDATGMAEFLISKGGQLRASRQPAAERWTCKLPASVYDLAVRFAQQQYPNKSTELFVLPPLAEETIRVN